MAAAASCSASHGTAYTGEWEYDVFLCFRGDDTRFGFTGHLMSALSDQQIRTFIDYNLEKTKSIDELISVLKRCALSVVVFSEKFADSVWCLKEVVTIAQRMEQFGHRVLPIFYKVDPLDVTNDFGSYAATIDHEYKARSTYLEDKKRWMDALKAVANCAGRTSQSIKNESELIKTVVEDVQKQLIDTSPSMTSANLVGMGSRILDVEQLLAMDTLDETRIIGLWGMGGVGKTTLAKACYERIVSSTKGIKHHFVEGIREKCGKKHGVEGIVNELYSKLLSEKNIGRRDLNVIHRRGRLSRSRVIVVLDDVETPSQLEQILLGDVTMSLDNLFALGSKIIVTTRDKRVLDYANATIYNVVDLSDSESVQLFSLRAFRKPRPPRDWQDMSCLAASYCKGNPLTLRVLGGTLFNQDERYWQSLLSELRLIENHEVGDILERSCNKLEVEEKRIFLDVACFLHGMSRSRLIVYMSTMHSCAYAKVKDLIDKTLLICEGENIKVHDLLKEMAWKIVNKEPNPRKRSRLIDPDDVHKLLTTPRDVTSWTRSFFKAMEMVLPGRRKKPKLVDSDPLEEDRATEGISLNLDAAKEMYLKDNVFDGMNSLTFLRFSSYNGENKKIHLPYGGLNSLPDGLRWLQWDGYPSKFLPLKFYPQHLVHLSIRHSPIQKCWEGYDQPQLVNLMVLNLSYCKNLIAIPNISNSTNLEELLLRGCESLVEVPSGVQYLTKLITLDLSECRKLKCLPPKLESKLLKHVRMSDLIDVTRCPEIDSRELVEFDLWDTSLVKLPRAIYNVKQDGYLRLSGKNITKFPAFTTSLKTFWLSHTSIRDIELSDHHHHHQTNSSALRFHELDFSKNLQLRSLPKSIWNVVSLRLHGSPLIESLPEISDPVTGLVRIYITGCGNLKSLPSSISNITSLESLDLSKTGIKSLPSGIQELRRLFLINLSHCKSLESMPTGIHKLNNLKYLYMNGCKSIPTLSELPPNLQLLHLDQTIPTEIVANFLVHASSSLSPKCQVVCSRSELPEWLTYGNTNSKEEEEEDCSIVKVELRLPNYDSDQAVITTGIAFGLVFSLDPCYSLVRIRCDCMVGNTIVASWPSNFMNFVSGDNSSSEKVWLMFDKNLSGEMAMGGQEDQPWYVKYAGLVVSFHIYFKNWYDETITEVQIKRCGVSLLC
ncbi:Disease resistance protein RUN1 [Linum grandiflorum]